jgi:hypothetical protein
VLPDTHDSSNSSAPALVAIGLVVLLVAVTSAMTFAILFH